MFDGAKHGYYAMYGIKGYDSIDCSDDKLNEERELEKYEYYSGEIEITLGYSIDYDDEMEEYEFAENGEVKLLYGTMDWDKAKTIGYDWISLKFKKCKKTFLDFELA